MAKIVVVGSINMDLVTRTDALPLPGETVLGGDLATIPGGKGANQAVAAARQGASVAMVGHIGADAFAADLLGTLGADSIDCAHVTAVDGASGVALIVVDAAGQNSIVVASGANSRLTPEAVAAAENTIAEADLLLLQLEVPLDAVETAAVLAKRHQVRVILNPAPAQPLPSSLLANVDLLIPNETEAETLTGIEANSPAGLRKATETLQKQGVGGVIFTLGGRGAAVAVDGNVKQIDAFPVDTVVDTTAAGDAFVGGLATALAEGQPILEAALHGVACGALAVTKAGAQPSLPLRADTNALVASASDAQKSGVAL